VEKDVIFLDVRVLFDEILTLDLDMKNIKLYLINQEHRLFLVVEIYLIIFFC